MSYRFMLLSCHTGSGKNWLTMLCRSVGHVSRLIITYWCHFTYVKCTVKSVDDIICNNLDPLKSSFIVHSLNSLGTPWLKYASISLGYISHLSDIKDIPTHYVLWGRLCGINKFLLLLTAIFFDYQCNKISVTKSQLIELLCLLFSYILSTNLYPVGLRYRICYKLWCEWC